MLSMIFIDNLSFSSTNSFSIKFDRIKFYLQHWQHIFGSFVPMMLMMMIYSPLTANFSNLIWISTKFNQKTDAGDNTVSLHTPELHRKWESTFWGENGKIIWIFFVLVATFFSHGNTFISMLIYSMRRYC
jgi:hypothetical protein